MLMSLSETEVDPSILADIALERIGALQTKLAAAEAKISTAGANIASLMNAYPDKYPRHAFQSTFDLLGAQAPKVDYYVVQVWGDVEPELHGPYTTDDERDAAAKKIREDDQDDLPGGVYWLDVTAVDAPEIGAYSGGFFQE